MSTEVKVTEVLMPVPCKKCGSEVSVVDTGYGYARYQIRCAGSHHPDPLYRLLIAVGGADHNAVVEEWNRRNQ